LGGTRGSLIDSTLVSSQRADGDVPHVPQRLTIGTGHTVATHLLPPEGILVVGRAPDASIRVDDASVSREHVRLHLGAVVQVEDLGSANGTRLGGNRLRPNELTPLVPGQVVEIGGSWMMVANAPLARSSTQHLSPPVETTPSPVVPAESSDEDGLVIQDKAMRNLHRLIERAALSDITVLLLGETGVGKEVFARRIHALSPRAGRPFLGLNCAAVAPSLFESELFGHERGAFTGAAQMKLGLLEAAEGGTVLLDEVGEMPLAIQVKLLRVLEERQVLRIGGTRPRPIDVRVLSATNRNLEADVQAGSFRRDLYFRLNSISVQIPALRERPLEIEPLARKFASLAAQRLGVTTPEIDATVWERLRQHRWPGNIRELRNVMERAVVLSERGRITTDALPVEMELGPTPQGPASGSIAGGLVHPTAAASAENDDERRRILDALDKCAGNQTRAAALLGISRRTLLNRLSEYDLPRPRKRGHP
jgi:transcriptional regulator with PAS, ATPase and Fis domain